MMPLVICTTVLVETSPQGLPLGAACVASALKTDALTKHKFHVELKDFSCEDSDIFGCPDEPERDKKAAVLIADKLVGGKEIPFALCFSVYMWNRSVLEFTAAEIKRRYPGIFCIAGGPEVTANPLTFCHFDFMCAGEGEVAIPQLVVRLSELRSDSMDVDLPQGIYSAPVSSGAAKAALSENLYGCDTRIIRAKSCDTESVSSPYLDGTIDPSVYGGALWELARGCPFNCSYCYESKGEKKVRYFPEKRLETELDLFAQKKIAQVFVLDPTYNANKTRALHILQMIAERAPGMFFYFEARAEFIDRKLAAAFTKIPCAVQIGLQSADPDVLALVHRSLDKKLFVRNVGFLNDAGAIFGFDLIYGLPGDSLNGFRNSIDFAMSLYPNNLELFCLSVLPGTDLNDRAAALGLVWQNTPPYHVVRTNKFTEDDMTRSEVIAHACNIFYNQGRAVPWFNAVVRPLHIKPSLFFADFAAWLDDSGIIPAAADRKCMQHHEIEKLQRDFIRVKYREKKLTLLEDAADDLIVLNGALSRSQADGTKETVTVHYHSDDLMSECATDLRFFTKNIRPCRCRVRVFDTVNGADWAEE